MRRDRIRTFFVQAAFFFLASAYIPITLTVDGYLAAHREHGRCLIEAPVCTYDSVFSTRLAQWRNDTQQSRLTNTIRNGADGLADIVSSGRTKSVLVDTIIIVFSMLILNIGRYCYVQIKEKLQ